MSDDGQLTMIELCVICGRSGVVVSPVPTVEPPDTPHHACFDAASRWLDRLPSPAPTADARLRRQARQRWRLPRNDGPELRVVS